MKTLSCYCALLLLCLTLYLPGIASIPIVDRDGPHFAQASRQMVLDDDYWNVRFQDQARHLKPPGIYWLHSISIKLFSSGESTAVWPYRLISVLGGMLAVLLTFGFAARVFGRRIALMAAALLAASPLLLIESHLIVTDSSLLATMVLMQGGLWQIYIHYREQRVSHWVWPLLFWLGMSAGILIKGITPLVALFTVIGVSIVDRNIRWLKHTRFYWGLPLVLALTAAWLVPLSINTHSNFLMDMLRQDALPKITSGQQSHGMPPGLHALLFSVLFWPGSLFIWHTIRRSGVQRMQPSIRFLLAWIIPSWLFFELTTTKLPEYVLPMYPAIAILVAQTVFQASSFRLQGVWRWLGRLQYVFWLILGFGIVDVAVILPHYFDHRLLPWSFVALAIMLITIISSLVAVRKNRLIHSAIINIAGMVLVSAITLQFILPNVHNFWVSQKVVTAIEQQAPSQLSDTSPLLTVGYHEPSLVFLLGGHRLIAASTRGAIQSLQWQPIHLVLVDSGHKSELMLLAQHAGIDLSPVAHIRGFDYAKGRWVNLILLKHENR